MLRTNLSTQPFYNERLVRVVLMLVAAGVVALALFNVEEIIRLRARDADVRRQADHAETQAAQLLAQAQQIRQTVNRTQLAAVQVAAQEANRLIDQRAFSWTDLFNRFERTLPGSVRIASVTPQVDAQGRMLVAVSVQSRRVEDLDAFILALEKTGSFRDVLSREEQASDDGTLLSVIQGYYLRSAPVAAGDVSGTPEPEAAAEVSR